MSMALYTTEILENIRSCLSALELIAAVNANDLFYKCAVNSPKLQDILCLRSGTKTRPQCYEIMRNRRDCRGFLGYMGTIGLTPCAGMLQDDSYQAARPIPTVRLSPALCLIRNETERDNRTKTLVTPDENSEFSRCDMVSLTIQPADLGRIGFEMFLCDPPAHAAFLRLCYRHTETSFEMHVYHDSEKDSPLVLGTLLEEARSAEGRVFSESGMNDSIAREHSIDAIASQFIKAYGGSFLLDLKQSWVMLYTIAPTEEEWETMRNVLVEEEAKRELMDPGEYAAWMDKLLLAGKKREIDA